MLARDIRKRLASEMSVAFSKTIRKHKKLAQANFDAPKIGYPCSALHKPADFLQYFLNVDFEPMVPMTTI